MEILFRELLFENYDFQFWGLWILKGVSLILNKMIPGNDFSTQLYLYANTKYNSVFSVIAAVEQQIDYFLLWK